MALATMTNKQTGETTILIYKSEFEQLRADLGKTRDELVEVKSEVISYCLQLELLQADFRVILERYKAYDSNILCRSIIWIQFFVKRIVKYIIGRIRERCKEDE